MKFQMTVNSRELTAMTRGINEVSNVMIDKDVITDEMIRDAKRNAQHANIHHAAGGWAQFRREETHEDSADYTLEVSLENEYMIKAINMMVKIVMYFMPLLTPLMGWVTNAKALLKNWKSFSQGLRKDFAEFEKPSTYATVTIFSKETDVAACVIVEKDGYGNEPHIIESVEITEHVGMNVLTRLWKQMESRIDTPTERYPHAEYVFDNIKDARENMERCLRSLRADYEGMQRAQKERAEEDQYCLSRDGVKADNQ